MIFEVFVDFVMCKFWLSGCIFFSSFVLGMKRIIGFFLLVFLYLFI